MLSTPLAAYGDSPTPFRLPHLGITRIPRTNGPLPSPYIHRGRSTSADVITRHGRRTGDISSPGRGSREATLLVPPSGRRGPTAMKTITPVEVRDHGQSAVSPCIPITNTPCVGTSGTVLRAACLRQIGATPNISMKTITLRHSHKYTGGAILAIARWPFEGQRLTFCNKTDHLATRINVDTVWAGSIYSTLSFGAKARKQNRAAPLTGFG